MSPRSFACSQCGAPDLESVREGTMRCPFCGSLYNYAVRGPSVIIRKSGTVVMGPNARVIVKGGLEIEEGAELQVEGELTLLERAPEDAVASARLRLREQG